MNMLPPLTDDEDDAVRLWAEIHNLRAEAASPVPGKTWRDLALEERIARVKKLGAPVLPLGWSIRRDEQTNTIWVTDPSSAVGEIALFIDSMDVRVRSYQRLCYDILKEQQA